LALLKQACNKHVCNKQAVMAFLKPRYFERAEFLVYEKW